MRVSPIGIQTIVSLLTLLFTPNPALTESLDDLTSDGWRITWQSTVAGAFRGCHYDLPVPINSGYIFICKEYSYHYAYHPVFDILSKDGDYKYVIDDEAFDGELYQGTPIYTYVTGSFEGCDYDRYIPLDNGLLFKCSMYSYHYAYHPEVMIVGNYVTIDNDKYEGQLYRR
jgi:hypothetical protein